MFMLILTLVLIFILGLIVGSFLNVVIYRLKNGGNIIWDRSRCPHCKKTLGFWDLIPVLSFLAFKAHCRYCRKNISWQYPLVELGAAITFIVVFLNLDLLKNNFFYIAGLGSISVFIFFCFILSLTIVIFVFDLRYYLIPDVVLIPGILVTLGMFLLSFASSGKFSFFNNILGALIFSGFFLVQYFLSRGRWVGGGDIKLGLFLGLILGWKFTIVCLFLAYLSGAIVAIFLIILKKKTRKDILPFGPFLISAFVFSLFYGNYFLNLYLNFLMR